MELRLDGKVALVTGASSGLGERFARVLAEAGAKVAIAARRTDRLAALASDIERSGGVAYSVAIDVTRVAAIESGVDRIERELGPLDVLVNNSGVTVTKKLGDYDEADYDHVMDTNAKGAFFVAQSVGTRMMKRAGGRIINVASVAGLRNLSRIGLYGMSKAAVIHMTRAMAAEWARFNINVNAICPGYIETELNSEYWATDGGKKLISMLPRRRLGQQSDLDGLIVYLASDLSGFVNGAIITADDGLSAG